MKLLSVFILSIALLLFGCGADSSTSAQLANQPNRNSQTNSNAAVQPPDKIEPLPNQYPQVLCGSFYLRDARKNLQTTADIVLRGEDVSATVNRGFDVNLPPIGTMVKMDMMNCAGYIGTAKVTYRGLQIMEVWTAELMPETHVADLEPKLLQCVDKPNDEFTRKYLSNTVYFLAPTNEKRKQIVNVKNPDWKAVVPAIPYEWRKVAKLPMFPTKKQAEECISNWLDSDGDGEIDLLTLCAFNEESVLESGGIYQYSRVLRLVNGSWREIWQTTDTKD